MRPVWGAWALRGAVGLWLLGLVGLPLAALLTRGLSGGLGGVWAAATSPEGSAALGVSLRCALVATGMSTLLGTLLAWALVRWEFPGRRLLDALVDLPVAMPTLVVGLLLLAATGPGTPAGELLAGLGLRVAFAPAGIVVALVFVTLPLVVRTVEPALAELDPAEEEAARTLGASPGRILRRVLLPPLWPAIAAGGAQAFARGLAEFGSVVVVSGNLPGSTLTVPVWILGEVEGGRVDRAAAVSVVLLALAVSLHALGKALAKRALGGSRG